jgi:MoxR-like ATPase
LSTPKDPAITAGTDPAVDRIFQWEKQVKSEFVERDDFIHGFGVALAAGEHMFGLGTPGTAKTNIVDRGVAYISDCIYFPILFTKFTTYDDLYGPVSLSALKQDREERITAGYLPECHVSQWDEAFKGSGASLNAGLWAINERQWRNGGQRLPIPLSTTVLLSNELPDNKNDSLAALYDRVMLRYVVEQVKDNNNFKKMLMMGDLTVPNPVMTWDDVETVKKIVRDLPVPEVVFDKLVELRRLLRDAGYEPSGRRWRKLIRILQAEAVLDGCSQVEIEHIAIAAHCLWERPEQIPDVEKIVLGLANPLQKKALDMLASIEGLAAEVETIISASDDDTDVAGPAMEIQKKIKRSNKALEQIEAEVGQSRRQQETVAHCRKRLYEVTVRLLKEVFNLSEDAVANMIAGKSGN